MRHSDIKLTMGVYTDPALLDVREAIGTLPALPLQGGRPEGVAARATEPEGRLNSPVQASRRALAPTLAPTADLSGQNLSPTGDIPPDAPLGAVAVSGSPDKRKEPLTTPVSGSPSGPGGIRTRDLLNAIRKCQTS